MMNRERHRQNTLKKSSKTPTQGIPEVLNAIRYEKLTEVVPVKVHFSLKKCLKRIAGKQAVSTWIRQLILDKLDQMQKKD